ncbi:putative protein serine/threonine kinase [Tieghemostelium lacteum]|uniref:non-specific serine/threonine protein kinase n=1 Tax=Tieghemostelium lacteum TaxID=361077 RepID=A0A151Z428_TIELA|nr:putative protein serine/threonine kinase [Tieghemostelium lacteum]|eukprot:KYQ88720.1 putative protein serine/threonine kinase [Tieghemostelium lacteum]
MEVEEGNYLQYNSNFIMNSLARDNNGQENLDDEIQYRDRGVQPKLIKNYILGDVLGEGAYGKVKDAMCSFTQKRVAIKILKRVRLKKIPGGEASVLKEISITKKLHNKHIVKLIDHFIIEEKGKLYIVYEYVGGGTLQQLLEHSPKGKLPMAQCQFIFKQLTDAIEYIHSQKILHRDIKPDNILFTHGNVLKLSDFGVSEDSSQIEDFECLSRSYGSPAFQPPELTQFQQTFSPFKIDIWAMGVTLYLMTIGKFPFSGTNMYTLFENISKCNIVFPTDIDKDLQSLIKGILQVDHNQRFTLEQIKSHPWCLKELPTEEFVPLLPETKFLPLEMAYGGDEEEELIFGYENDPDQISSISHSTIVKHNNSNHFYHDKNITLSSSSSSLNDSKDDIVVPNNSNIINELQSSSDELSNHQLNVNTQAQPPQQNQDPRSSPQPPLRNSSNRRPKITFESPVDKNKCIVQ